MRVGIWGGNHVSRMQTRDVIEMMGHFVQELPGSPDLSRKLLNVSLDAMVVIIDTLPSSSQSFDLCLQEHGGENFTGIPILFSILREKLHTLREVLASSQHDFIVRPCDQSELELRLECLLSRSRGQRSGDPLVFGSYRLLPGVLSVNWRHHTVRLKRREFDVAVLLFSNVGRLVKREELLRSVWQRSGSDPTRAVDVAVSRVRTLLGLTEDGEYILSSVYRMGYRLDLVEAQGSTHAWNYQRPAEKAVNTLAHFA